MLTFDPEVTSTAAAATALEDSVTMLGDLWLAADLDIRDSILQLRRQHRGRSVLRTGWEAGWQTKDTQGKQSAALCWASRYKGYDYFLTPPHDLSHSQWLCSGCVNTVVGALCSKHSSDAWSDTHTPGHTSYTHPDNKPKWGKKQKNKALCWSNMHVCTIWHTHVHTHTIFGQLLRNPHPI